MDLAGGKMKFEKKYSIIYPDFEDVEYKKLSETAFHDLSLDILCKNLTDDDRESELIKGIITNMTADPRVAQYRQKVFCDILNSPDLRKRMMELFDKFEFMRNFGLHYKNTDEKKRNLVLASQIGRA